MRIYGGVSYKGRPYAGVGTSVRVGGRRKRSAVGDDVHPLSILGVMKSKTRVPPWPNTTGARVWHVISGLIAVPLALAWTALMFWPLFWLLTR